MLISNRNVMVSSTTPIDRGSQRGHQTYVVTCDIADGIMVGPIYDIKF